MEARTARLSRELVARAIKSRCTTKAYSPILRAPPCAYTSARSGARRLKKKLSKIRFSHVYTLNYHLGRLSWRSGGPDPNSGWAFFLTQWNTSTFFQRISNKPIIFGQALTPGVSPAQPSPAHPSTPVAKWSPQWMGERMGFRRRF